MSDLNKEKTERYDKLIIDFNQTRAGVKIAIVKNFPGLFAEMNEVELRAMAHDLTIAADNRPCNKFCVTAMG